MLDNIEFGSENATADFDPIARVPDEMRGLLKKMLQLNPSERLNAYQAVTELFQLYPKFGTDLKKQEIKRIDEEYQQMCDGFRKIAANEAFSVIQNEYATPPQRRFKNRMNNNLTSSVD